MSLEEEIKKREAHAELRFVVFESKPGDHQNTLMGIHIAGCQDCLIYSLATEMASNKMLSDLLLDAVQLSIVMKATGETPKTLTIHESVNGQSPQDN